MNTVVPILFAIVLLAFFFLLYSFLSFLICSFRLFFHPPGSSVSSFPALTLSSPSRFIPSFINLQITRRSSLSTTFFFSLFNRFYLFSSSCLVTTADLSVWHHYPLSLPRDLVFVTDRLFKSSQSYLHTNNQAVYTSLWKLITAFQGRQRSWQSLFCFVIAKRF